MNHFVKFLHSLKKNDNASLIEAIQQGFNVLFESPVPIITANDIDGFEYSTDFKTWFKDSKIVDSNGIPIVMFRGDIKDRDIFDISYNDGRPGTYWTSEKEYAQSYVDYSEEEKDSKQLYSAFISMKNPKIMEEINDATDWEFYRSDKAYNYPLKGYDGILYNDGYREIIAFPFKASQIKSVDSKRFMPTKDSIHESK